MCRIRSIKINLFFDEFVRFPPFDSPRCECAALQQSLKHNKQDTIRAPQSQWRNNIISEEEEEEVPFALSLVLPSLLPPMLSLSLSSSSSSSFNSFELELSTN